jgi:hypothetical protein
VVYLVYSLFAFLFYASAWSPELISSVHASDTAINFQASPVAQQSRGCVPVQLLFLLLTSAANYGTPEPVASFLV